MFSKSKLIAELSKYNIFQNPHSAFLEKAAEIAEKNNDDEELNQVSHKLGSMFRGKQDRKRVAQIKADLALAKAEKESAEMVEAGKEAQKEIDEFKAAEETLIAVADLGPETVEGAQADLKKEGAEAKEAVEEYEKETAEAVAAVEAAQEAQAEADAIPEAEFDEANGLEEPVESSPVNAEVIADEIVAEALNHAVSDVESF